MWHTFLHSFYHQILVLDRQCLVLVKEKRFVNEMNTGPHAYQVTVGNFVFWGLFKILPTHLATVSHIDNDVSFLIK